MEYNSKTRTIQNIKSNIDKGLIKFDHYLQREENQWNRKTKSLFIDTILRGYIINPIIVIKDNKILSIIDGIQRLSTIRDYINNQFALSKDMDILEYYDIDSEQMESFDLSEKKYRALPLSIQQMILETELRFYEITDYTDKEIRDNFARLNAGKPLTQKQLRKTVTTQQFQDAITDILSLPLMTPITKEERGMKKLITPTMKKGATDRDIIIQTLMLIESSNGNYELNSFTTNDINDFVNWYNINLNDDVISQLKVTINTLNEYIHYISLKPTTTPFMLYAAYKVIDSDTDITSFITNLKNFIENYKDNANYINIVQAGTTSPQSVKARLDYWNNMIK